MSPAPTNVTVYYSPYGGKVLAIVEPAEGDPSYERALDRGGTEWRKAKVAHKDTPFLKEGGYNVSNAVCVEQGEGDKKKYVVEVRPG